MFDSPILGLVALAMAAWCCFLASRLPVVGRWLLRVGTVAACGAVAGTNVRCERPLGIAVMVDVSPSTRGATFRDPKSVTARLTPLLAGRPYTLHYFADGEQPTAVEPAAERTRWPVPVDADAVVLMSDGRFELPASTPPVYAVVDPSLDHPSDAAVTDVTAVDGGLSIRIVTPGGRDLQGITWSAPTWIAQPATGPGTVFLPGDPRYLPQSVRFAPSDAWPENDSLPVGRPAIAERREAFGKPLPGFINNGTADVSLGRVFVDDSVIVMPIGADRGGPFQIPMPAIESMVEAVRDYGATLVLYGPPARLSSPLRVLSPLRATPPAGPQRWTILLDGSGSMAANDTLGGNKWHIALGAAMTALDDLPGEARVSLLAFAAEVRTLAAEQSPGELKHALMTRGRIDPPGGPTGLRSALLSLASRPADGPSRVLLLSDGDAELGDVEALAAMLNKNRVRLDAVLTTSTPALAQLCEATGGRAIVSANPSSWSEALGGLASVAAPPIEKTERWAGRGLLAGHDIWTTTRWPAYAAKDAQVLAGDEASPVAAVWQIGLGRVVAIAGDIEGHGMNTSDVPAAAALAKAAIRLERPPADPRFAITFDERDGTSRVVARDKDGPMNGLSLQLRRGGQPLPFVATGPGQYAAPLARTAVPGLAEVLINGRVVGRAILAGRYAAEFDRIGNDRVTLTALARRSGGAMIEAGNNRPIELPRRWLDRSLVAALSVIAALSWLGAVAVVRGGSRRGNGN